MTSSLHHAHEDASNAVRDGLSRYEPRCLRTYTPSQAVLAKSAGVFHWTPEGRRLYDFTSGVLVANLGHNPQRWLQRLIGLMGWSDIGSSKSGAYSPALPLTAYNAATPLEIEATRRLVEVLQGRPGGKRLQQVLWAASGSEAIQKALWAALARDRNRDIILATRYGFHGKKGLAGAVTGCETDHDRDPRVRFVSFPMTECRDVTLRDRPFDPAPYRKELDGLLQQFGRRLGVLITEPYLGGGGSYHPPAEYLQMLQSFCREITRGAIRSGSSSGGGGFAGLWSASGGALAGAVVASALGSAGDAAGLSRSPPVSPASADGVASASTGSQLRQASLGCAA